MERGEVPERRSVAVHLLHFPPQQAVDLPQHGERYGRTLDAGTVLHATVYKCLHEEIRQDGRNDLHAVFYEPTDYPFVGE